MSAVRSVREAYDLWHPPEETIIRFGFKDGHVWIRRTRKVHFEIAPPLVDCAECMNMELGAIVYILEAWGQFAGIIRFQARKTKLSPEQELKALEAATAFAPTNSEGEE